MEKSIELKIKEWLKKAILFCQTIFL